jgi:type IV pilus assembly protein PilA
MKAAINKLRGKRTDEGFTLVELLVVVVIIGVLVAIAIPMYGSYRKGAANKSAQSDVRGAITAVEQYYSENGNLYPTTVTGGTNNTAMSFTKQTNGTDGTATVSPGNQLAFATGTGAAGATYYVLCAQNTDSKVFYGYNSGKGESVHKSTYQATNGTLAACLTAEAANTP